MSATFNLPTMETDAPASRINPVLLVLPLMAAIALYGLPFLKTAPNRLVSGEPIYFSALLQGPAVLMALSLGVLFVMAFFRPAPAVLWAAIAISSLLVLGLILLAASHAALLAQTQAPIARTSLGGGFWVAVLVAGLLAADGLQRLRAGRTPRLLVLAAVALMIGLMLTAGWCDELAIMKEYASRADIFWPMVLRHLHIVGVSLLLALCIGLPLGWAADRFGRVGKSLFPVLNIIQTVPSIALFGLLMAPLALLAASWPWLGRAGISGVGLVPGVIALVLYSLLPVVRGMVTGMAQVPHSVVEAATGLGMAPVTIFWKVEVPLALPVVLVGVRTAAVQAVGLTAVTALIGAGGLGAIMFEGLYANAQDLVLLGVLPIVVIGVVVDAAFSGLISLAARRYAQDVQNMQHD
jgi:osmoprotectant transport system permease protein